PGCEGGDVNEDGAINSADVVALVPLIVPTVIPTATPTPRSGPRIVYAGVANADGTILSPVAVDADGTLTFQRPNGFGFQLVVEAVPGPDGAAPAPVVFNSNPVDPGARPDLQIEATRPLGDGNPSICSEGGIPGMDPIDFGPDQRVANALNDFSCGF